MATQTPYDVVTKAQSVGEALPTDDSAKPIFESAARAAPADSTFIKNTSTTIKPEAMLEPVEDELFSGNEVANLQSPKVNCCRNVEADMTDHEDIFEPGDC